MIEKVSIRYGGKGDIKDAAADTGDQKIRITGSFLLAVKPRRCMDGNCALLLLPVSISSWRQFIPARITSRDMTNKAV